MNQLALAFERQELVRHCAVRLVVESGGEEGGGPSVKLVVTDRNNVARSVGHANVSQSLMRHKPVF